ncbi:uncharacterized protein LOC106180167 [Lingula anatina]|uniref:Uncharacterized protein LOC106180167 n=1 Tax=Lingula anatina TaxID=7574 RepID=A0A1S3KAK5_LINAN|nr:uncharacterized protein LOC106180167 [Lingula anatina]|eukprot:XP_013419527.1 uncharacterized protein LOC106180167 [Lingula anatina]
MVGSASRVCLPSATWSGQKTACLPKQCPDIRSEDGLIPQNGFVNLPCHTDFKSRCTIGCYDGHYMDDFVKNFRECIVDADGSVSWSTDLIECKEISTCSPNPCRHGGVCVPINVTTFQCDCTGTGYHGNTCERGHIASPVDVESLLLHRQTKTFTITARPVESLTIIPYSDFNSIEFIPSSVTMNSTVTSATFAMVPRRTGTWIISYKLSGPSASEYDPIPVSVVSVARPRFPAELSVFERLGIAPGTLPMGQFWLNVSLLSGELSLMSTEEWFTDPTLEHVNFTGGIVQLMTPSFTVPLTLYGLAVEWKGTPLTLKVSEMTIEQEAHLSNYDSSRWKGSLIKPDATRMSQKDITALEESNSLAKAIANVYAQYFPKWLNISFSFDRDSRVNVPVQVDTKSKATIADWMNYSKSNVFLSMESSVTANITLGESTMTLHSGEINMRTTLKALPTNASAMFINITSEMASELQSTEMFRALDNYGWKVGVEQIGFSGLQGFEFTSLALNVDRIIGDVWVQFVVNKTFDDASSKSATTLNLQGGSVVQTQDLVKSVYRQLPAFAGGKGRLLLDHAVQNSNLWTVESEDAAWAATLGNTNTLDFNMVDSVVLLSPLNKYIKPDKNVQGRVTFHCSVPNPCSIGHFTLTFPGTICFGRLCLSDSNPVHLDMEPNGETTVISEVGHGENLTSHVAIQDNCNITMAMDGSQSVTGQVPVKLSLLDNVVPVVMVIGNETLSISSTIQLNSSYPLLVNVSSSFADTSLPPSWNLQGRFVDGDGGRESLQGSLEGQFYRYFSGISNIVDERIKVIDQALENARNGYNEAQALVLGAKTTLDNATNVLQQADANVVRIEEELRVVEGEFQAAFGHLEATREAVEGLCTTVSCPAVAVSGELCEVKDTVVDKKITTECCAQCTKVSQVVRQYVCRTTCFDFKKIEEITDYWSCGMFGGFFSGCSGGKVVTKFEVHIKVYDCRENEKYCPMLVNKAEDKTCCEPCEKIIESGIVPVEECRVVPNLHYVSDPVCVARNSECNKIIRSAYAALGKSRNESFEILDQLQKLRISANVARLEKEGQQVRHDSAERKYQSALILNDTKHSYLKQAKRSKEQLVAQLRDALLLQKKLVDHTKPLSVEYVQINMSLPEDKVTVIPVTIGVDEFSLGKKEYVTFLDNGNLQQSMVNAVLLISRQIYGDIEAATRSKRSAMPSRRLRRQVSDQNSTSDVIHVENSCKVFTAILNYLNASIQLDKTLRPRNQTTDDNMTSSVSHLKELSQKTYSVDLNTTGIRLLNLTEQDLINLSSQSENNETAAMKNVISLLDQELTDAGANSNNSNNIELWYYAMQNFSLPDSLSETFNCYSFSDCILTELQMLSDILLTSKYVQAKQMLSRVQEIRQSFEMSLVIFDSKNFTRETQTLFATQLSDFFSLLVTLRNEHAICGETPTISSQSNFTEFVRQGDPTRLTCDVTGTPTPAITWKKNGLHLASVSGSNLEIPKEIVTDGDSYECVGTNHFGVVTSFPMRIQVVWAPTVVSHPESTATTYMNPRSTAFTCNASGSPQPGYEWYFARSANGTKQLINDSGSSMLLIRQPTANQTGFYFCRAYNDYGEVFSQPAKLTVLSIKTASPFAQLSFKVTPKYLAMTIPVGRILLSYDDTTNLTTVNMEDSTAISFTTLMTNTTGADAMSTAEPATTTSVDSSVSLDRYKNITQIISELLRPFNLSLFTISSERKYANDAEDLKAYIIGQNMSERDTPFIDYTDFAIALAESVVNLNTTLQDINSKLASQDNFYLGENPVVIGNISSALIHPFCSIGSGLSQNGFLCAPCIPGTYRGQADIVKSGSCLKCTKGFYQPDMGQTSCLSCPVGNSTASEGATEVEQCKDACPPGTYSASGVSDPACLPCPRGTYMPNTTATSCVPCEDTHYTLAEGAVSPTLCIAKCTPGSYSPTGLEPCEWCPKGSYQALDMMTTCDQCEADTSTNGTGATAKSDCFKLCPPGTSSPSGLESPTCMPCEKGTYQDEKEQKTCKRCAGHNTTISTGLQSELDCLEQCAPGTFSITGVAPCAKCKFGQFQPKYGQTFCERCEFGKTTLGVGSESAEECSVINLKQGKYDGNIWTWELLLISLISAIVISVTMLLIMCIKTGGLQKGTSSPKHKRFGKCTQSDSNEQLPRHLVIDQSGTHTVNATYDTTWFPSGDGAREEPEPDYNDDQISEKFSQYAENYPDVLGQEEPVPDYPGAPQRVEESSSESESGPDPEPDYDVALPVMEDEPEADYNMVDFKHPVGGRSVEPTYDVSKL